MNIDEALFCLVPAGFRRVGHRCGDERNERKTLSQVVEYYKSTYEMSEDEAAFYDGGFEILYIVDGVYVTDKISTREAKRIIKLKEL